MFADFNWLGAIVAAVVAIFIGFIWYMPPVFGNVWMKALGKRPEDLGNPQAALFNALAMNVISAFVLTQVFQMLGVTTLASAIQIALLLALGLVVSNQVLRDKFHGTPSKVSLINGANTVAVYLGMAVAIVLVE